MTESETVNTLTSASIEDSVKQEIGKATKRFDDFLTFAGLQKKEYQTEGIQFCLKNELASDSLPHQVRGGIVDDWTHLGEFPEANTRRFTCRARQTMGATNPQKYRTPSSRFLRRREENNHATNARKCPRSYYDIWSHGSPLICPNFAQGCIEIDTHTFRHPNSRESALWCKMGACYFR